MSDIKWIMDVNRMRDFLPRMVKCCNLFCIQQEAVDTAYNNTTATWCDKNCLETGVQLRNSGRLLGEFHEFLSNQVKVLHKECDYRATRYLESAPITLPSFTAFSVKIKEDPTMGNQAVNTDINALRKFAARLEEYIQSINGDVAYLKREYVDIGSSWHDLQYKKFGDVLSEFEQKMKIQERNLGIILAYVKKKIQVMEQAPSGM